VKPPYLGGRGWRGLCPGRARAIESYGPLSCLHAAKPCPESDPDTDSAIAFPELRSRLIAATPSRREEGRLHGPDLRVHGQMRVYAT